MIGTLRFVWLLALLAAAALIGVWLRADPGYLFLRWQGYEIRTYLVVAVAVTVLVGILCVLVYWLLFRWPKKLLAQQRARRARDLDLATLARIEGRPKLAEKLYERATGYPTLRAGALLQHADLAESLGDHQRAQVLLSQAAALPAAKHAAQLQALRLRPNDAESLADLRALAAATNPPPAALGMLAERLAAAGDWRGALEHLQKARKSRGTGPDQLHQLQRQVLRHCLQTAADSEALLAVWRGVPSKDYRRDGEAIALLGAAERRLLLDKPGLAADALVAAMKREWDPKLALLYPELPGVAGAQALRRAEGWLSAHPKSPELLLGLARLCRREELWGKARDYLNMALAQSPSAAAWEEWGRLSDAQSDQREARRGYLNALRVARGESAA